jgi:hypothetical protein
VEEAILPSKRQALVDGEGDLERYHGEVKDVEGRKQIKGKAQ